MSGLLGQSEDGDAFVQRMMKERGITDSMQQYYPQDEDNENSPGAQNDQVSEKDNKGRQPSPDDIGAHLHYETGGEE